MTDAAAMNSASLTATIPRGVSCSNERTMIPRARSFCGLVDRTSEECDIAREDTLARRAHSWNEPGTVRWETRADEGVPQAAEVVAIPLPAEERALAGLDPCMVVIDEQGREIDRWGNPVGAHIGKRDDRTDP